MQPDEDFLVSFRDAYVFSCAKSLFINTQLKQSVNERSVDAKLYPNSVFALKRCGGSPVCAHVASANAMADWLGSGQNKRSAGVCSAKHDAGDLARLLLSSAERSVPECAGWFQRAARARFCFDRVGNRGRDFTGAVRYRLFSARSHSATKCAQFYF